MMVIHSGSECIMLSRKPCILVDPEDTWGPQETDATR